MKGHLCFPAAACAALAVGLPGIGRAPGGTSSTLSGVVLGGGGWVMPGADVVAKYDATSRSAMDFVNLLAGVSTPG